MKRRTSVLLVLFALVGISAGLYLNTQSALANGGIFAAFQVAYPNSETKMAECQICHVSDSGGEPWNAYGWSIRQGINDDGLATLAAIAAVEMLDADGNGISNIDEINANAAPGWTTGNVHTAYFKNGTTSSDQPPPELSIALDASITVTEPMTTTPGTTPLPPIPITSTLPYDEASDGDLSGDPLAPNLFTLGMGSNVITATSVQGDREYFTIIVPEGTVLDSIILESYTSDGERSFIGIQRGITFTEPYSDAVASNLLGYALMGGEPATAGTDILDDMGQGADSIGFSGPLPAGTYALWAQETGADAATYRLNFVIRNPFTLYLPVVYNVARTSAD